MKNNEWKDLVKPGTKCGMIFYPVLFFLCGLMLVTIGFWKMLLVALLTLVGLFIGASDNLKSGISAAVNKAIPQKNQKVVYSQEEIDMLNSLRKDKEQEKEAESASEKKSEDK